MHGTLGHSLKNLMWVKIRKNRMMTVLLVLSILVSLYVFFMLRQPGLTLAGDATCGIPEHSHDEACSTQVLVCGFMEEAHVHDDSCYEIYTVEAQENHQLVCQETEQPHTHSDGCYETTVSEAILNTVLICENAEEGHVHEDACYITEEIPGTEETILVCDLVSEPHEHTESCYTVEIIEGYEERILICEIEECDHTHDDSCYVWEMICGQEEHVHKIECYSDQTADVETPLNWQQMFAGYPYTGNLRKDLAGIACTQVGYAESELNFEVDGNGTRHGYTRYGAWYGAPYSDWSAMFVSFCLNYAGADSGEAPGNTGASSMAKAWDRLGKYASAGEYFPSAGDLVFFRDSTVGIVADVRGSTFDAICGDVNDAVKRVSMSVGDSSIKGWGTTVGTVPVEEETIEPTAEPTVEPTVEPTAEPTVESSVEPTAEPTVEPTAEPTVDPTAEPTVESSVEPTAEPTVESTLEPTVEPTMEVAADSLAGAGEKTPEPTLEATLEPTVEPTLEAAVEPTAEPTMPVAPDAPVGTGEETPEPTVEATLEPTTDPFAEPTMPVASDILEDPDSELEGELEGELEEGSEFEEQDSAAWGKRGADILDISNGPAVFIFAAGDVPQEMQIQLFARNAMRTMDLLSYLEANGGSYFFTLLDLNNVELPKDENGNYIAQANTGYKLTTSFISPEGFLPGTYQYQVPNGLMVDGGEGTFVLSDGTVVGSWVVTDTGLITMVFNENINSRTDITISATMGILFPEQEEPIDFDGKITVTVEKPPEQQFPTELIKWGAQGGTANTDGTDPSKFYWTIRIDGHQDSQIPGNILSDQVVFGPWSKTHRYTESDIAGGLSFDVSENGNWHRWHVSADDPHLAWTETGWSYKMPKTVICETCGELELGNDGWVYYVNYTSTPDPAGTAGTFGYENMATLDGQEAYAWTDFTHGEVSGEVAKRGSFVSDAGGGAFLWEVQTTIPGRRTGQKADYHWYLMDYMYLQNAEGNRTGPVENDIQLATVTASYGGTTIQVPRIQDATTSDPFAWYHAWTATSNGTNYGREIHLLCRCQCNADNCRFWNDGCENYWFKRDDGSGASNGFCLCWTETETVTFTFIYKTDDLSVVENYGGLGYQVQNIAELYYKPNGTGAGALVSNDDASVPVPGLFKKELTHDFDGYIANYNVTINEAKLVLTDGSPLYIHDVMTDTLAYVGGSLVITAEDADGNITTLQQGTDYTVAYDGTGSQTDAEGNKVHVLDIAILYPQPVMYILDYDATLIMPENVTGGIKYSNSATITLWNEDISASVVEKTYADINIAAKSYRVEMFKTCAETNAPLAGAAFGLYNAQGGLITTDVTDANGELHFESNIIEGIILREHILYYMQELRAPSGYQLDDTKHWFCFCDKMDDSCEICDEVIASTNAVRIPFEQIGKVNASNQILRYHLPSTGGPGIYPFVLVGVVFVITPLVYCLIQRRKQERGGKE